MNHIYYVIDDVPAHTRIIKMEIKQYDPTAMVDEAYSVSAVEVLMERTEEPHCITVDLNIKAGTDELEGLQLVKRLRKTFPHTKIMVLSGNAKVEDIHTFLSVKNYIDAYLHKDTIGREFRFALESVLEFGDFYLAKRFRMARRWKLNMKHDTTCGLTPTCWKILNFMLEGYSSSRIAEELILEADKKKGIERSIRELKEYRKTEEYKKRFRVKKGSVSMAKARIRADWDTPEGMSWDRDLYIFREALLRGVPKAKAFLLEVGIETLVTRPPEGSCSPAKE